MRPNMRHRGHGKGGRKGKNPIKTLKRLISYIFKENKFKLFMVVGLIIFSSLATVASTLFLKTLIDDYITPFVGQANPNFTGLFKTLCIMAVIYYSGAFA